MGRGDESVAGETGGAWGGGGAGGSRRLVGVGGGERSRRLLGNNTFTSGRDGEKKLELADRREGVLSKQGGLY